MTAENKLIVQKALAGLVETGDVDVLGSFLSDSFVHHRPDLRPRAKTEWLADVRAAQKPLTGLEVEIRHLIADGDHVVVHSRRRVPGAAPEVVVVDICRVDGGLITDIWETIEPVSHAAANLTWWEPATTRD